MAEKAKLESLDAQIRKTEEEVIRKGDAYNAVCEKLKNLRAKRTAVEHDELIAAFVKSGKSYEEVMAFLGADVSAEDQAGTAKRRGRPRKKRGEADE